MQQQVNSELRVRLAFLVAVILSLGLALTAPEAAGAMQTDPEPGHPQEDCSMGEFFKEVEDDVSGQKVANNSAVVTLSSSGGSFTFTFTVTGQGQGTVTVNRPFKGRIFFKAGEPHFPLEFSNETGPKPFDFDNDLSHIDICIEESDDPPPPDDEDPPDDGDPPGGGGGGQYGGDGQYGGGGSEPFPRKGVEAGSGGSASDGSSVLPLLLAGGAVLTLLVGAGGFFLRRWG